MQRIVLGPMDPPIRPAEGECLSGLHVIQCGALYGRVLFTEWSPLIEVTADRVVIRDCVLERLGAREEA